MRLWHYKLISVLPRKQLLGQYRELFAIKGAIEKNGTPNHPLVDWVLDYSLTEFKTYFEMVACEMRKRGYKHNDVKYLEFMQWSSDKFGVRNGNQFYGYQMDDRYLRQCFYNLQEKYDCGMIADEEYGAIEIACADVLKGVQL